MAKRIVKGYVPTKSKFFSMEANPKGASVGNFVNNIKSLGGAVKSVGKALATPVAKKRGIRRAGQPVAPYKRKGYKPSNGVGVGY